MTDRNGIFHHVTLPVGLIEEQLWTKQKEVAAATLPQPFAELVRATVNPFVQAITDVKSDEISGMGGKVLLVGDAVAGFRPHTAASTNQAALHASLVRKVFQKEADLEDVVKIMMRYADYASQSGIRMGTSMGLGPSP